MLSKEAYLRDPCGSLSIPWWKHRTIRMPEGMEIVHHRDFSSRHLDGCADQPYFRLYHGLTALQPPEIPGFSIVTADDAHLEAMASVINRSYTDLRVSLPQLEGYRQTPVFAPALWIMAVEQATGRCAACGIADYDRQLGELILEWVQVLPQYRRKTLGQALVCELLRRGKAHRARFATVSGQVNNPASPEALYRKCGFTGSDVWHILRKAEL